MCSRLFIPFSLFLLTVTLTAPAQVRDVVDDLLPRFGQPRPYDLERIPDEVDIPESEPKVTEIDDDTELLKELGSLYFTDDESDLLAEGREPLQPIFVKAGLVMNDSALMDRLRREYIGQPVTMNRLRELVIAIIDFYRSQDMPVVDVVIAEQDITSGTIQMLILEGRLGEVRVEENRWFSDRHFSREIRLRRNQRILAQPLIDDVSIINRSIFHKAEVVFEPGQETGQTDLVLKVDDRFPVDVYVGYEDTGNDLTGDERYIAGMNWGNAFWQGHLLSYQYSTSTDFSTFDAHSFSYTAPLWRGHQLRAYLSISESQAETPSGGANPIDVTGETIQSGVDYSYELPSPSRSFRHSVSAGFQFRQLENALDLNTVSLRSELIEVLQWVLSYSAFLRDPYGYTFLEGRYFYSPGGLTDLNSTAPFMNSRFMADTDYHYTQLSLNRLVELPHEFEARFRMTGQLADSNLVASEQLPVGGFDTVRGYTEAEVRGDQGYFLNLELYTPPLSVGRLFGCETAEDELRFLGFWDYGMVANRTLTVGENPDTELSGAGGGLRYSWDRFLSLRFDYGFQLIDTGFNSRFDSRFHIGVILSY
jgi:hemolysin activation/secretion protein